MKNVVMVVGGRYHPFGPCGRLGKEFLEGTGKYGVEVTEDLEVLTSLQDRAAVILYTCGLEMSDAQLAGLVEFVRSGGGLVAMHSATASFRNQPGFADLVGSSFLSHPAEHPHFRVTIDDPNHPITIRLGDFEITDEFYRLTDVRDDVHVLASSPFEGEPAPMMYIRTEGEGRIFYNALGHAEEQWRHPHLRKSLLHGLDWVTHHPSRSGFARVGILGFGDWGARHVPLIQNTPGLMLTAICDSNRLRRDVAARDMPDVTRYADSAQLFADEQVDVVLVALPHRHHAPAALEALRAGKHVVVEKPFTLTVADADAVIDQARQVDRLASVYHNRRWDRDFTTIRDVVRSGAIGEVFEISCGRARYERPGDDGFDGWWIQKDASGGILYPWGPHLVDWILQIVPGRVRHVQGFFQKKVWHHHTNEDHGLAVLRFENGCMGEVFVSDISAVPRPRWRIVGTRGGILDDGSDPDAGKLYTWRHGQTHVATLPWAPQDRWIEYWWLLADHLLRDDPPPVTAEDARRVVGVLEAAQRSSQSHQAEAFE